VSYLREFEEIACNVAEFIPKAVGFNINLIFGQPCEEGGVFSHFVFELLQHY